MMFSRVSLPLAMLLALGGPAAAQMYPGQGVAVNPAAVSGGQVLRYPGGQYVRVVPPLLQPGTPYPGTQAEPIHLHYPTPHHRVARRHAPEARVASAPVETETPPAAEAPPPPVQRKRRVAVTPPPPPAQEEPVAEEAPPPASSTAIPFSFGGPAPVQQAPSVTQKRSAVAPAPQRATPPPAAPQPAAPRAQTQVASVAPPPLTTKMSPSEEPAGLSKRSEILFPHNGTDPSPETLEKLKQLAGDLNSALDAGARRVQLDAFGGAPGDKSSDARRVSLKRALVIRQLLINDGVPSSRIDVRAMGGIDDNGNADRVDVYVRAG